MQTTARLSLFVALIVLAATPARADQDEKRHITVQGRGEVAAVPDMAVVGAGIENRAPTAKQAMGATERGLAKLIAVLKAAGIAGRDLRTANLNLSQLHQPRGGGKRQPPAAAGYRASGNLTIKIRDIAKTGEIIDILIDAGANRFSGLSFAIADREPLRDQARALAVADAKRRAQTLARAAGVTLGEILAIREGHTVRFANNAPRIQVMAARADPIAPGEQQIRATVTITFAIK